MGGTVVRRGIACISAAFVLAAMIGAPAASGEALSPWWGVTSGSQPTNLVSGKTGRIVVTAENRGDASTSGEVRIVDTLPPGLEATAIEGVAETNGGGDRGAVSCTLATLTCTFGVGESTNWEGEKTPDSLRPYEEIEVDISVSVGAGVGGTESLRNVATVSGGGAAGGGGSVSASHALEVNGRERFGVEDFQMIAENAGGSIDTQAGSHPFQLTSVVTLDTTTPEQDGGPRTVALAKDIVTELPPGLIADPAGLARCTEVQFGIDACPAQSVVGVLAVRFSEQGFKGFEAARTPIFNLEPSPGEPARFGVELAGVPGFLETSIRSGGDYGVTLAANNIAEDVSLLSLKLTFWGVPGDRRHDAQRGLECLEGSGTCTPSEASAPPPFLSLPSTCGKPLQGTVSGEEWERPGRLEALASYAIGSLVGCERLPFEPQVHVTPGGAAASTPTGLSVDLRVPQTVAPPAEGPDLGYEDLTESSVEDIAVTLPAGVALNPPVADGLEACSEGLAGFTGFGELDPVTEPGVESPTFTAKLPGSLAARAAGDGEPLRPGVNFCPDASKIGTVTLKTPLLANPLQGAVYLAAPQNFSGMAPENPFGSLVAVYVVAEEPESGVLVELAGEMTLDPRTGQVTASFQNTPQLPFEELDLDFFEGERAPLSTPARCGVYTTTATLTPWSGEEPVSTSSDFEITSGPGGGPCPGAGVGGLPFDPSLTAGTTSLDAGAFTPLTATISRADGQQAIESVRLTLPPGLSGILAGVALCPEAQANAGTCGPASEIGETTLGVGLGGDPYTLTGKVYLTERYDGAPFGLAIVVPARVGPFTLLQGRPIVVRAKLEIDPATAALTIATGLIPQIIEGVPLQIQHLNITIGRSGFIFNPSSCNPMKIEGTIAGGEGARAPVSSSFQMADCADLKFDPKLTALTRANGELAGHGASLHVAIASPAGQANIRSLKLDLPQRLPARLETIQKACPEKTFDQNPAACPKASVVGSASVQTPILSTTMTGPAYLVSKSGADTAHRGESKTETEEAAFPDLVLLLQGEGVKIELTGALFVSAKNITSVAFRSIPDVPIRRLDLILPEGKTRSWPPARGCARSGRCS